MRIWLKTHLFEILDVLKFIGIAILMLMFIRFNAAIADNARIAKENTATTRAVVQSQSAILEAIRQLSLDTKISNEQKTNIIICMLQVPVDQRTTDTLRNCRRQVETPAQSTTTQPSPSTPQPTQTSSASQATASPTTTPSTKPQPQSLLNRFIKALGL